MAALTSREAVRTGTQSVNVAIAQARKTALGRFATAWGELRAGEGAILQVQRMESGAWSDFPVTMSVSGGTFATYVQTSRTGPNKFRVVDTDSDAVSNEVTVTVG